MKNPRIALLAVLLFAMGAAGARPNQSAPTVGASGHHRQYLPLIASPWTNRSYIGHATYYNATGAGACSFEATPDDLMVAAVNPVQYNNALLCGAYVEVSGPDGAIVVRIVDLCPECPSGDLDLSQEAFALLADPIQGHVPITWRVVSPQLTGPIVYHLRDTSNEWWAQVQVRNHRNPILKFEVRGANGSFRELPRESYNFFTADTGLGSGPYTFRVTDVYGHQLIDTGVMLTPGDSAAGDDQFPAP